MIDFTTKIKAENDYVCQINIILILFEIKCIFIYYNRVFSFLSPLNASEKRRYTYTKEGIMIYREAIHMLNTILEEKDPYTAGHSRRVAYYASKIAENLGLDAKEQTLAHETGLLHDVGKLLTPRIHSFKTQAFYQKRAHHYATSCDR